MATLNRGQQQVLAVLQSASTFGWNGLTDEELYRQIAALTNGRSQTESSVRSRRKELERLGLVRQTETCKISPAGRKMHVWEAVKIA